MILCQHQDSHLTLHSFYFHTSQSGDYQRGCQGRHNERYIFSGSLIPILTQLLAGASSITSDDEIFRVVRVETSGQSDLLSTSKGSEENAEDVDEIMEVSKSNNAIEVGQGVAFAMKNLGSSVLRGVVHKKGKSKWLLYYSLPLCKAFH